MHKFCPGGHYSNFQIDFTFILLNFAWDVNIKNVSGCGKKQSAPTPPFCQK